MGKLTTGKSISWPAGTRATRVRRIWFDRIASAPAGLRLEELASHLQATYPKAQRWARFFGYPILDGRREKGVDWTRVDWSLRDSEIARRLDVSRERARQVRRSMGAGLCAARATAERFAAFISANFDTLQARTVAQTLEMSSLDLAWSVARRIMRAAGVKPFRAVKKWADLDWRLPNRDLASILQLDPRRLATIRANLKVGPAHWSAFRGGTVTDPDYRKALANARKAMGRRNTANEKIALRSTTPSKSKRSGGKPAKRPRKPRQNRS
jgi:hypothetical protein